MKTSATAVLCICAVMALDRADAEDKREAQLFPMKHETGWGWGYCTRTGSVVIPLKYYYAGQFNEGLAPVITGQNEQMDLLVAYLDAKGIQVISPQPRGAVKFITQFSKPDQLTKPRDEERMSFCSGLAPVLRSGKYGYMNRKGELVIKPTFDEAYSFSEGLAAVRVGDKIGYVDAKGEIVIKPQFEYVGSFSEGMAEVRLPGADKWGYINKTGTIEIPTRYDITDKFSEGVAAVCQTNKWGYIDKMANFVIKPQFDTAWSFSEGLAAARIGGHIGYINTNATIVIPPTFDEAFSFRHGIAMVITTNSRVKYIKRDGSFAW